MSSAKSKKKRSGHEIPRGNTSEDPFGLLETPYLHYGTVIAHIRQRLGLNQGDFGALLEGFTQTTISRYEAAESEPTLEFWRKLARYFGLNLSWVFTGDGDPYASGFDNKEWRDRAARFLTAKYMRATGEERFRLREDEKAQEYFGLSRPKRVRNFDMKKIEEIFAPSIGLIGDELSKRSPT